MAHIFGFSVIRVILEERFYSLNLNLKMPMHKNTEHQDEISILHNPNCSKAKKALAYAKSITKKVASYEFSHSKTTPTQWRHIFSALGKGPKEILDKSLPYYQENIRGREFEEEDWLHVVIKNPQLIRSPIAMRAGRALILDNPTDIYQL